MKVCFNFIASNVSVLHIPKKQRMLHMMLAYNILMFLYVLKRTVN